MNDLPIPPVDKSKRPKGYVAKKPEEDPDWIEYWYFMAILCFYTPVFWEVYGNQGVH